MNSHEAERRSNPGALLGKFLGIIFHVVFLGAWLVKAVESWHRGAFFAAAFFVVPPVFFTLLGIGRIRDTIRTVRQRFRRSQASLPVQVAPGVQDGVNPVSASEEADEPNRLQLLALAFFLVPFALLWDWGIFLHLVPDVLRSWRSGQPDWTLTIASIPFLFGTLLVNSLAIGACSLLFSQDEHGGRLDSGVLRGVRGHEYVPVDPQSVTKSSGHPASPGYRTGYGGGAWQWEPSASGVQNATSGPPNPPPGYTAKPLSYGAAVELLPPRSLAIGRWIILIFLVPWSIVWNKVSITCLLAFLGVTQGCNVERNSVWEVTVSTLIGVAVAVIVLNVAFVRRHWIVGRGRMAHRTSIPVLRLAWDRIYHDVAAFEIRHAVWDTGRGYADSLRFRTTGNTEKIRVDVERDPSAIGLRERSKLGMDPDIVAMGRYLADRTGTKLEVVTEMVPEPSGD